MQLLATKVVGPPTERLTVIPPGPPERHRLAFLLRLPRDTPPTPGYVGLMPETPLDMATRHVVEGRRIVEAQERLIVELRRGWARLACKAGRGAASDVPRFSEDI
jgi:hypothetical protein